jgi:hypothetical protein
MGDLYIKLLNGKPVDHPVTRENIISIYPGFNFDNLPDSWAKFIRVSQPACGPYEVAECFYEWVGDVVKDVWYIYPMSNEEKAAKQDRVKRNYLADGGYTNWVFDDERCVHVPPVPMPQDGKAYTWVQQASAWVEVTLHAFKPTVVNPGLSNTPPLPPPYPTDGKQYRYDEGSNSWILRLADTPMPPIYPTDGKQYRYDEGSNSWILKV